VAEQQERLADLEAEAERLWAVVDALPTTKDGVTIMLDMTVYVMTETGVRARHVCGLDQFGVRVPPHEYSARTEIGYDECYSTREAAETAGAK
jgi:hypothetical protein